MERSRNPRHGSTYLRTATILSMSNLNLRIAIGLRALARHHPGFCTGRRAQHGALVSDAPIPGLRLISRSSGPLFSGLQFS